MTTRVRVRNAGSNAQMSASRTGLVVRRSVRFGRHDSRVSVSPLESAVRTCAGRIFERVLPDASKDKISLDLDGQNPAARDRALAVRKWLLSGVVASAVLTAGGAQAAMVVADIATAQTSASPVGVLLATALALFAALPGATMFQAGLVRAGSVNSLLLHRLGMVAIVPLMWCAFGHAAAYSTTGLVEGHVSWRSFIGVVDGAALASLWNGTLALNAATALHGLYQLAPALLAPCFLAAAATERMRLGASLLFSALWLPCVYVPAVHAVQAGPGSLLGDLGVLDAAGGLPLCVAVGFSAVMVAAVLGSRRRKGTGKHNLPLAALGALMLWMGWFGITMGSALLAGASVAAAAVCTQAAASAAVLTWIVVDCAAGTPSLVGGMHALVAGLAAITPAVTLVSTAGAAVIGASAAIACRWALAKQTVDDPAGVSVDFGVGGLTGTLLAGVFCHPNMGGSVASAAVSTQYLVQTFAAGVVAVWSLLATFVCLKVVAVICGGLRVSAEVEDFGTDQQLIETEAYGTE